MMIIFPLVLAIMMLVAVIAVGAVMLSLSSTAIALNAVGSVTASRTIRLLIFAGGCLGFLYGWTALGPVTHDGAEGLFEWMIKITIGLLSLSIVLGAAALALRVMQGLKQRRALGKAANPYAVAIGGMMIGVIALVAIEESYYRWTADPPPILLSLDGEPTHCVWRSVRLYENRADAQHFPDRYAMRLNPGDRVRLDPDVVLTHDRFSVKFRVSQSETDIDVHGRSTDFRSLRHVDDACGFR